MFGDAKCYSIVTVLALLLLLSPFGIAHGEASSTRIVVFTPTTKNNTYWPQVHEIMTAAAADLGVELLLFEFAVDDRFAKINEGVEVIRTVPGIDGAILSVAFGQAEPLLQETESRGIPVIVQGPLFRSELRRLGGAPRQLYESWIALFEHDEYRKGYYLGELLIEEAIDLGLTDGEGGLQVIGLGGDTSWQGSTERAEGLRRAVNESPEADLMQVVPTDWTVSEAYRLTTALLTRYPSTSVIWAASDQLASGASAAMRDSGEEIGEDFVVGGLDLSREGLERVNDGTLTATVSSWLFSYAEVLICLYDYIHGFDFASERGVEIDFDVHVATEENAQSYLDMYSALSRIDFRDFSKAHTSSIEEYDFSLEAFEAATKDQR